MAYKVLPKLRVVFDLDECMVRSFMNSKNRLVHGPEAKVHPLPILNGFMIERPHLHKGFDMIKCTENAEIFMFTAGTREYAEEAVNAIDPDRKYFKKVFARENCTEVNGVWGKNLEVLEKDFIPERTILIDNQTYSFIFQPDNGYHIEHFMPKLRSEDGLHLDIVRTNVSTLENFDHDNHFLSASEFVSNTLISEPDVRVPLRKKFNLRHIVETQWKFDLKEYQKRQKKENVGRNK